jgi:exonuclease III
MELRYSGTVFLVLVGILAVATAGNTRDIRVITWNINGVRKLSYLPSVTNYLGKHDVVLLQETFSYEDKDLLELRGFLGHHARAIPGDRRNLWGLSTLFRTRTFADGFLEKVFSPCDWVLVSRWRQPGLPGLTIVNIYAQLHSRFVHMLVF